MAKKFFSVFAAFALLFTACETATESAKFHITSNTTLQIDAPGCFNATYVIDEVVEGAKIAATPNVEWIHINGIDEEACTIQFCVDENTGEARTGKIEVTYAGTKEDITINQAASEGAGKFHITTPTTIEVDVPGCFNAYYEIDEAVEGATVAATSNVEWIHINGIDEEACAIQFCVDENTGEARTGKIEVTYASAKEYITINQAAAVIE